jgi:membrane protease YdiL (CAAX protease family)
MSWPALDSLAVAMIQLSRSSPSDGLARRPWREVAEGAGLFPRSISACTRSKALRVPPASGYEEALAPPGAGPFVLAIVLAIVLAAAVAFSEETIFRGELMQRL